jgi:hypothetical protein
MDDQRSTLEKALDSARKEKDMALIESLSAGGGDKNMNQRDTSLSSKKSVGVR